MYSIGQVAEMFGLPISTLRYYDKQGLFPNMERASGIRRFSDQEIEALRVIECLKRAGMEIKDIRQFMDWCAEGPSTYPQRKAMFEERKAHMKAEIAHMNRALDMLKFKCWYYEQESSDYIVQPPQGWEFGDAGGSVCQGRTGGGPSGRNCVSARKAGWLLQGLPRLPEVGALRHPRRCRRNCRQNA